MEPDKKIDELLHSGILGMRWGHRKNNKPIDTEKKEKSITDLSDNEIQKLTNRQRLLNDYQRVNNERVQLYLSSIDSNDALKKKSPKQKIIDHVKKLFESVFDGAVSGAKTISQKFLTKKVTKALKIEDAPKTTKTITENINRTITKITNEDLVTARTSGAGAKAVNKVIKKASVKIKR